MRVRRSRLACDSDALCDFDRRIHTSESHEASISHVIQLAEAGRAARRGWAEGGGPGWRDWAGLREAGRAGGTGLAGAGLGWGRVGGGGAGGGGGGLMWLKWSVQRAAYVPAAGAPRGCIVCAVLSVPIPAWAGRSGLPPS